MRPSRVHFAIAVAVALIAVGAWLALAVQTRAPMAWAALGVTVAVAAGNGWALVRRAPWALLIWPAEAKVALPPQAARPLRRWLCLPYLVVLWLGRDGCRPGPVVLIWRDALERRAHRALRRYLRQLAHHGPGTTGSG